MAWMLVVGYLTVCACHGRQRQQVDEKLHLGVWYVRVQVGQAKKVGRREKSPRWAGEGNTNGATSLPVARSHLKSPGVDMQCRLVVLLQAIVWGKCIGRCCWCEFGG